MIFREVVSVKNNKPFIEGLVVFSEKLPHKVVKRVLGATYAKNSHQIEHTIRNFKTGDFFEVQIEPSVSVSQFLKATVRGGLEMFGSGLEVLSRMSKHAALCIE